MGPINESKLILNYSYVDQCITMLITGTWLCNVNKTFTKFTSQIEKLEVTVSSKVIFRDGQMSAQ